jgi:hypothetical protein
VGASRLTLLSLAVSALAGAMLRIARLEAVAEFSRSGCQAVHLWGDSRAFRFDFHGAMAGQCENEAKQ